MRSQTGEILDFVWEIDLSEVTEDPRHQQFDRTVELPMQECMNAHVMPR